MKFQLSEWAIRKPIPTIVIFLALTVAGLFSFDKLPINANPVITFPVVTVTITQSGSSPSELENAVTQPVERAISGLPGIRHINSTITDGVSITIVEFSLNVDPNVAINDIREQITQIRAELPQTIEEPLISRIDVEGGAILNYAVQSKNKSLTELSWFVDDTLSKKLLTVKGSQKITRLGGTTREILVEPDPVKMAALKISITDINHLLLQNNVNIPGGNMTVAGQNHTIRVLGAKNEVDYLRQLKLPLNNNNWVTLGDIATISDSHKEAVTIARLNGKEVVGFAVYRARGSSDTAVEKGVTQALEEIRQDHPDIDIKLVTSNVKYTVDSYNLTMQTLFEGAALTVIVVFFFLKSLRATLIAAIALPLSILPTFIVLYIFGYTLNSITLLALTLVIGILVDDAIVEIENIEKYIERGERPYIAAIKASNAIGFAIIAITITIVAVFLPVSFVGGFVGKYFVPFGITVSAAVLSSLLVARLVTPLMSAYLLLPRKSSPEKEKKADDVEMPKWIKTYLSLLGRTLKFRKTALAVASVFLLGSLVLVDLLPSGFLPKSDVSIAKIEVETPPGTQAAQSDKVLQQIINKLKDRSEIIDIFSVAGADDSSGNINQNKSSILINLVPINERKLSQREFEQSLAPVLNEIPDIRYNLGNNDGGRDVSIVLASDNPEILSQTVNQLRHEMMGVTGLKNIQILQPLPRREVIVKPNIAEAARAGVTTENIGSVIRTATIGAGDANVSKFNLPDRQVPIRVLLSKENRDSLTVLNDLYVNSTSGTNVPIKSIADISFSSGPDKIERISRQRKAAIEADLSGIEIGTALEQIDKLPSLKNLPPEVKRVLYGDVEYMDEMFDRFSTTMLLSVLMVLAILIILFKDFLQPLTILIALPFAIGGAIIALLLYNAAIDMPVIIGLLMLMGIVTKNSILLVEFILERARSGMSRNEAIIQAGRERVRPIIMTTIAMIAGMIPLVLTSGADASFRAPMAIAVIGGLLSSTLLSLLFVPVIYSYMDDFKNFITPYLRKLSSVTKDDLDYH
ncbi:aminoglycoside/multidrug efflux system [Xenorhabdus mauleonii]|uniref:Aminoglycoside/multidrug efflux system n=1 Tax=Xenorhabdus mauleonii TaxID=351675 RepID=A0A1I3USJ4_9GAMM|nr:efflux RND transporter permease subunit [Xenorhabdus mauleonii]PHM38003.1 aminoglycoside/multidrug efflux system [Xenorhabdus mauleonii]SFJ85699.1 hydrophobe/amphiphile efflux-1 (HAE1) family protein [Xenorhabdus mauleonii]